MILPRRPEQFGTEGPLRENKAGVGVKKGKPIKTVSRCISRGPVGPIHHH